VAVSVSRSTGYVDEVGKEVHAKRELRDASNRSDAQAADQQRFAGRFIVGTVFGSGTAILYLR
jgi:hypothetical protein